MLQVVADSLEGVVLTQNEGFIPQLKENDTDQILWVGLELSV